MNTVNSSQFSPCLSALEITFEISHVIWYKMNKVDKMIRPNLIRQTEEM